MPMMRLSDVNKMMSQRGHQEMPHNMGIGEKKIGKVMREFKAGTLHIGKSKKIVKNRKQAVAISLNEARKVGAKIPLKKS